MNKFFKIILFVFLLIGNAYAQSSEETSVQTPQKEPSVDLNAPAPAAPFQLRIPHSERTKGNILDSALDFLFMRFFKNFENSEVSYEFFEVDNKMELNFKNFKIKITRPDIEGTVVIPKFVVNFSEFMEALKTKRFAFSKATINQPSVDLVLIKEKTRRKLKFTAKEMIVKDMTIVSWTTKNSAGTNSNVTIGAAFAENSLLTLSDPAEKYGASAIELKEILLPQSVLSKFTFVSAEVNGKTYQDKASFLQAVKQ